ncbi:MAG: exodeoxyribonuclease VII large subunit [Oscillospiraceae bacterium]|nr:exodeoxyribonuclease VII large subunit [Oscillospiraceae bacterium]
MEQKILSVTELNQLVRGKLERDSDLQSVCIRGEISNYKLYPSGHHYFSLKDSESAIRCVLFKGNALSLRFRPENGMQVLAVGRVSLYPRDGSYQFYCTRLLPDGAGDLSVAFEQLKQKLFQEGLFDSARKKQLPVFPHRIGIVTSPAGAAVHDMLRILGKRYPLSRVILLPVRVQGAEAPGEIARAIDYANAHAIADVLIVGRGGGSVEDLWAFNDEGVSRTIHRSRIPVVSAVGHEPDVTISDFTADLRAATPSNAAELVAPDQSELRAALEGMRASMLASMRQRLTRSRQQLTGLSASPMLRNPMNYLQERRLRLDKLTGDFRRVGTRLLQARRQGLIRLSASLDAMSPLKVLARGYSMTADADGRLISSVTEVSPGQSLTILVSDGKIRAAVERTEGETI